MVIGKAVWPRLMNHLPEKAEKCPPTKPLFDTEV